MSDSAGQLAIHMHKVVWKQCSWPQGSWHKWRIWVRMEVTASGNKMKTSGMSPKPDNDEMQDWRIITKRKKKIQRTPTICRGRRGSYKWQEGTLAWKCKTWGRKLHKHENTWVRLAGEWDRRISLWNNVTNFSARWSSRWHISYLVT